MKYQHGGDIYTSKYCIDFSTNINPFGMNEQVKNAAIAAIHHSTNYPDTDCRALKRAVAESLSIHEGSLIFGNGAADVLFSLVLARKPKKALLVSPFFHEYEQALRSVECEIHFYDRKEEDGFQLTESFLKILDTNMKEGIELLFLCTPDNPTGGMIERELLFKIIKNCEENNVLLVLDESFIEFVDDGEECSMISEVEHYKMLFLLRSFTKMYGMPGLRLGFGVSADHEQIRKMEEVRQPWNVSIPAQAAGAVAISQKEWVKHTRRYVSEQRCRMSAELQRLGVRVYESTANYILFYSDAELMEPLRENGILIRDCSNYRGLKKGYYRIAIRREEENKKLLYALYNILR